MKTALRLVPPQMGVRVKGKRLVAAEQPHTCAVGGEEDAKLTGGLLPEQEAGRIATAQLAGARSERRDCLAW